MDPIIITIDGIPGSGKTYLCNNLNNPDIKCIDMDNLFFECKKIVIENNKDRSFETLNDCTYELIQNTIAKYKDKKIIIFVGFGLFIPFAKYKFFITLNNINLIYRRFCMREFYKIYDNKSCILDTLNNNQYREEYLAEIIFHDINLVEFIMTFHNYEKMYINKKHDAHMKGITLADQDYIINFIKLIPK